MSAAESRFDEVGERLIGLVMAGLTLEDAARRVDLKPETLRRWLRLGRSEPEGRFGEFAVAIDDARRSIEVDDSPMTEEEFERHLARAVRKGSLTAMKTWAARHSSQPATQAPSSVSEDPADEFAFLDELAERRARAAS